MAAIKDMSELLVQVKDGNADLLKRVLHCKILDFIQKLMENH